MDGAQPFLPPGVHDISAERYHADPCAVPSLSSTLARKLLKQSPRHAWNDHPRLNPAWEPNDSKTFDIGRAAHRAVLGKGGIYVAYPADILDARGSATTKAAKDWADGVRQAGCVPLKADDVDKVGLVAEAVREQLSVMGITLDPSRSELTAIAQVDGVWCRCMVDNAPTDPRLPLYDLKTTTDASPESLAKTIAAYGYDMQAAHYLAVWKAATGEDRKFRIIFVEKDAPYGVSVAELYRKPGDEADWFDHADLNIQNAIRTWGECIQSGKWPCYPARVAVIGAPGWHLSKMEAQADRSAAVTQSTIDRATAWQKPGDVA